MQINLAGKTASSQCSVIPEPSSKHGSALRFPSENTLPEHMEATDDHNAADACVCNLSKESASDKLPAVTKQAGKVLAETMQMTNYPKWHMDAQVIILNGANNMLPVNSSAVGMQRSYPRSCKASRDTHEHITHQLQCMA